MYKKLEFETKLLEGIIVERNNRFLMKVLINNEVNLCHCPCTGRISNFLLKNLPCLLSYNNNPKRKTKYTVEAISLSDLNDINKKWIGINQIKSNLYIEYFLKTNQLNNIINFNESTKILREQTICDSKLDFLIDNCYLEVKTPLVILPLKNEYITNKNLQTKEIAKFNSFDRFFKHINDLSNSLQNHQKAYLINFYMFEANVFKPPKNKDSEYVLKQLNKIKNKKFEIWQVNTIFDEEGISLKDYYKLNF